jgi:CHRD domain
MKNTLPSALAALALVGFSAAVAFADDSMMSAKPVTVTMNAQNGSGETGTATLTQSGADIVVKIDIKNGTSAAQPAHIHEGTCAKLNPAPKYPLTNVVDGKSTSTLKDMKLSSLETGGFAINVHKSTSDLGTYVSCGDIAKGMAPKPASSM